MLSNLNLLIIYVYGVITVLLAWAQSAVGDAVEPRLKALFHPSQKPTRKLAARTFIQSQYLKALAASSRVGFCNEWKRGFTTKKQHSQCSGAVISGAPFTSEILGSILSLPKVSQRSAESRGFSEIFSGFLQQGTG